MALTKISGEVIQTPLNVGVVTATSFFGTLIGNVTGTVAISTSVIGGIASVSQLNVVGVSTFGSNIFLGDGDIAYFGDGNDLLIFHNSTDSIIRDDGTGDLFIQGGNRIRFTNPTGIETYAVFNQDGSSELYFDNIKTLETTGAGVSVYGGVTATGVSTFSNNLEVTGIVTARVGTAVTFTGGVDISNAVETVSIASTYAIANSTNVILECDARNGTVFTHSIATSGPVGIVSLRNFPATKNSLTTYTILFTQNSTGTGNTTGLTGIGTNIRLTPRSIAGFSTSARVSSASTITLASVANDIDIVSFAVHYNGGATGTVGNYNVYATRSGNFRYGVVRP